MSFVCFLQEEPFRITIGNDQFQKRPDERFEDRLHPSLSDRLGPPISREPDPRYGRDSGDTYRRDDPGYRDSGPPDRYRESFRDSDYDELYRHERDPGRGPDPRGYPDRGGPSGPGASLFPAGAPKGNLMKEAPLYSRTASDVSSSAAAPPGSRPLKSILKKADAAKESTPPEKKLTPGLAGISNYADDIEDEEKFLYGEDERGKGLRRDSYRENQRFQQRDAPQLTRPAPQSDIRAAAQAWQPSQPTTESIAETVTGVVTKLLGVQQQQTLQQALSGGFPQAPFSNQAQQQYPPQQNTATSGDGDLWNLLAKSVQTAQQQQPQFGGLANLGLPQAQPGLAAGLQGLPTQYQANVPTAPQAVPNRQQEAGYDPTIENILKSIGFDFDMSKRMQEKAKQTNDPPVKPEVPAEQFGINQTASFIGSGMSHDEMKTKLLEKGQAGVETLIKEAKQNVYTHDERDSRDGRGRNLSDDRDRVRESRDRESIGSRDRGSRDARDRESISSRDRGHREYDDRRPSGHLSPSRQSPRYSNKDSPRTRLSAFERDLSPVSAEGTPPPSFDLSPIEIKRKSRLERNRSPGWERAFNDKDRDVRADSRDRRSRSRSWGRIVITAGRGSSRSPHRSRSGSPRRIHVSPLRRRSPSPRRRSISPRKSPGRGYSPRRSPGRGYSPRKRSPSPRRSLSPRRRSPRRSLSPRNRRSISPRRKRSASPGRRRSPSPKARRRSLSPRRRSGSPRGRKRSYSPKGRRSRSRDRKMKRSRSRERKGKRSRSRDKRNSSKSPIRIGSRSLSRSLSVSSTSTDPDNKFYFSSPLHGPPKKIPGQYYAPPMQGPPPGPPPFGLPGSYPLPPVMPPFSVPPPFGMPTTPVPAFGPPPQENLQPQPPGTEFEMPLTLPGRVYPATLTEVRRERSRSRDRGRRSRSSSRSGDRRDRRRDSRERRKGRSRDRSKERDHRDRRSRDRDHKDRRSRERSRDRERKDKRSSEHSKERDRRDRRSKEREKSKEKDRRDIKSSDRSKERDSKDGKLREVTKSSKETDDKKGRERNASSSSSKKGALPPMAENFEIKASTNGHDRVVIIGGKDKPKSPTEKTKETKSVNIFDNSRWSAAAEKEKLSREREKLNKENVERQEKIKTLVSELVSLKTQQKELTKVGGSNDFASSQILIENNKLQVEIQEEIEKLQKEEKQTSEAIEGLLKKELALTEKKAAPSADGKETPARKDSAKGTDPEAVSTTSKQKEKDQVIMI